MSQFVTVVIASIATSLATMYLIERITEKWRDSDR